MKLTYLGIDIDEVVSRKDTQAKYSVIAFRNKDGNIVNIQFINLNSRTVVKALRNEFPFCELIELTGPSQHRIARKLCNEAIEDQPEPFKTQIRGYHWMKEATMQKRKETVKAAKQDEPIVKVRKAIITPVDAPDSPNHFVDFPSPELKE